MLKGVVLLCLVLSARATCRTELNIYDPYGSSLVFTDGRSTVILNNASLGSLFGGSCDLTLNYGSPPLFLACNGRDVAFVNLGNTSEINKQYKVGITTVGTFEPYLSILASPTDPSDITIGGQAGGSSRQPMKLTWTKPPQGVLNVGDVYLIRYHSVDANSTQMIVKMIVTSQTTYYENGYRITGIKTLGLVWDVIFHAAKTNYDPYDSTNAPCYYTKGPNYALPPGQGPGQELGQSEIPLIIAIVSLGIAVISLLVAVVAVSKSKKSASYTPIQ